MVILTLVHHLIFFSQSLCLCVPPFSIYMAESSRKRIKQEPADELPNSRSDGAFSDNFMFTCK